MSDLEIRVQRLELRVAQLEKLLQEALDKKSTPESEPESEIDDFDVYDDYEPPNEW